MDHSIERFSPVLFVSGSGRSGTNITKNIFSRHSQIASLPFEYRFTIDPRGILDFYNTYPQIWSPFWPDYKINDFLSFLHSLAEQSDEKKETAKTATKLDPKGLSISPPSYSGWELNQWIPNFTELIDELGKSLIAYKYPAIWPGTNAGISHNEMHFAPHLQKKELLPIFQYFLEQITQRILSKQNKSVFLEDNTYNILFASDILDLYPNSKLLHIVRSPLDVLASAQNQRWTPSNVKHLIVWYKQIMDKWFLEERKCDTGRIKVVRFEKLIENPTETIEEISLFFGLDSEKQMFELDLGSHNIGRYKTAFSKPEIELINRELDHYLHKLGYN